MRFSRDRRGYEHTYVLHASRGQGRPEPRILYWFRTPPHVRVGRAAIDEEAIRLLEDAHPDVQFEWSRMLKAQPPPPPPHEDQPRRRRQKGGRPERGRPQEPRRELVAVVAEPVPLESESAEPELVEAEALEADPETEEPREPLELLEPAVLERLRTRYAELLTRINQRITDAVQRDVLRGEAERLNPETWVTAEEARTGLEHFEQWFEAIRAQLPLPNRRRRRRRNRGGGQGPGPGRSGSPGEV
ncbi:MAG: hypothetical protein ACRD1S_02865 [Vicinamibacterales bacterium]